MAGVQDWYEEKANPLGETDLGQTPTLGSDQSVPASDFAKWATGQSGERKLQYTVNEARKKNPDRQAEIFNLRGKTGLPAQLIERNFDMVKQRASQADFDAKKFRQEFPKLSGLLQEQENAEIAHDDLQALQILERTLTREKFEDMGPIDWLLNAPRAAYKQGALGEDRNNLAFQQMMGDDSEGLEGRLTALEGKLGNDFSGDSWVGSAITSASEFLPQTISSLEAGFETGITGATAGASVAAIAGQLGPQAATPEEIVTVPGAAAVGFAAGSRTGAAQYSFRQEAGAAFREFMSFRDDEGNKLDPTTARIAATVSGGVNAGLELFGLETLVKSFPGGKKVLAGVSRNSIKAALKQPTVRRALSDLGKRFAGVWTVETMTEVMQEGVTILGGELAKQIDSGQFEGMTAEQVEERLTETFVQAAGGMAILSAPGPLINFAMDYGRVRGAQQNQRVMESLGEGAAASKVRERLPQKFREIVGKLREDGDIENVQIPVEKWDELFQSAGVDPQLMSAEVTGNYKAYTEAKATGGDLVIPIEAYAEKLAATEWHGQLTDNARFRPDQMTPAEARDWQANEGDMVQNFVDSVRDQPADASQAIFDDVYGQLQGAGRDNPTAEREAKLTQSVFRSLGERMGVDPLELYRQYNVSINRPLPEILRTPGGDFDPAIDPVLDRLRAGQMPSQSDAFGQSLMDFIRERGVQDPGGDLASRDVDVNLRPFQRRAIRDEGIGLDDMAREAALAGYMPGFDPDTVTQNDLLSFVEQELQGDPVFPVEGGNQQLREARDAMLALQEYLDNMGIDLSQMDNAAIRAMLEGRQAAPEAREDTGDGVTLEQGAAANWEDGQVDSDINPDIQIAWPTDDLEAGYPPSLTAYLSDNAAGAHVMMEMNADGTAASVTESVVENQGQGIGRRIYESLIKFLGDRGIAFESDSQISPAGQAMYRSLERDGYQVNRIQEGEVQENGWIEADGPIYRVTPPVDESAPLPDTSGIDVQEGNDFAEFQRLIQQARGQRGQGQADQEPARTIVGRPANDGWSDATSIRGNDGQPAKLYRGSSRQLTPQDFEPGSLGQATQNPSAPLGVWFTSDAQDAARYGNPSEFYADIRNPAVFPADEVPQFDTPEQAVAFREDLQQQGFDGAVFDYSDIEGPIHVVAFEPDQVIEPDTVSLNQDQITGIQAFADMSREEFLGDPTITSDRNAADLRPSDITTDAERQPFLDGQYEAVYDDAAAAVYDGDKVIASYKFGKNLVVDKKYRRKGIAEELVYQWRTRFPGPAKAEDRTKKSQRIQEKVWDRIQRELNQTKTLQQDQTETAEFQAWAGEGATVVDPDDINETDFSGPGPYVLRVFHGTTNDFSVFDATVKGNMEGQFGAVNYFTSDRGDADANYAGEGPDLTSRIEQRAERLEDEIADAIEDDGLDAVLEFYGLDPDEFTDDPAQIATEIARQELSGGQNQVMELFVRTENPFVVGSNESPFMEIIDFEQLENDAIERVADDEGVTVDEVRENIDDYQDQIDDARMDLEVDQENPLIEAIQTVAARYDFDAADLLDAVAEFSLEGGMQSELEQLLRNTEALSYAEDPETGDLAGFHALGEIIQEMGYDSIILKNANERFSNMDMGGNTAHVHVFNSTPSNIKSATGNVGAFSRQDPDIFMQGRDRQRGPRGRITFPQSRRFFDIELLEGADLSTFIHESGHLYLEVLRDLAERDDAPQQIRDDFQTILDWFGVERGEQIATEQHEQWARGFEAYIMEGKAPSAELRSVFARFKAWMLAIYKTIQNLNVELTDDVRGVMDRLVATDQEIAEAQQDAGYQPLFDGAEQAGMSPDEFAQYQKLATQARQESEDTVTREVMTEYQRERKKWWREARQGVREEVAAEVNQQPEYVAAAVMGRGKLPDGSDLPEGMEPFKMSKQILVNMGYSGSLSRLPRPYVYTRSGGIHPDQAAEIFGYRSGDEMLQAMINARPRRKLIEAETDRRMTERYGDMMEDGGISQAAENAVHNDRRAEVMAVELRKLGTRSNRRTPPKQVLADAAARIIGEKRVRDLQPNLYLRAENKASREAFDAVANGDFEAATQAKQRQLFNHYLYREATRARQDVEKTVDLMNKYTKKAARQRIGKAGADYLEQIDALLARYEFRRGVSLRQIDRRQSLREFVDSQNEQGFTVDVPDDVLNDARTVNYKEIGVEELRGLRDAVRQIEHMARLKNKLLASADERTFEEQVEAIVSTIDENHARKPEPPLYVEEMKKRFGDFVSDAHAWHMKPEFIFRWLDGDAETGTVWRALFKPIADAELAEQQMQERVTEQLNEIMDSYTRTERAEWHTQKIYVNAIGQSMNKASILSVALNWGNDYNRQVVMEGHGWNDAQVAEILANLDGRDWALVQSLWDLIDGFWPDIAQMERDLNGVAPEKVQPTKIVNEYGEFKGGYYPIKYDPTAAVKTARREEKAGDSLFENSYSKPATKTGHTKERAGSGGQRVRLDLDVLSEHIGNVIHDLTHRRAIVDVNRLSENKRVREAIQQTAGRQVYDQIRPWLQAVANEVLQPQSFWEKLIGRARVGATVVNMGLKVTTAIVQPLGYLNSIDLLGERYAWRGLRDFFGNRGNGDFYAPWRNMKNAVEFVQARSVMMQNRQKTFDRDVRDSLRRLTKETRLQQAQRSFFILTGLMDMGVSVPTWLGAYKKAMEGAVEEIPAGDEARAIDYADSLVRQSQSAGGAKDLARIQRGGEVQRSFVMFYSYFSVLYNQFARKAGRIKSGQAGLPEIAASAFYLWFAPAILGELVAMRGPEDEDEWATWAARQGILYPAGTIVGVRDVVNAALTPYGYGTSPAFDAFAMTARAATIPVAALDPDDEVTRADVKSAVLAAGYWGKLPSRQAWITGEYIYDLATGADEPESPQDFVRDLFFSRPADER